MMDGDQGFDVRPRGIGIVSHPSYQFGTPCVGFSRIPAETIAGMVWAGEDIAALADDYAITRHDVLLACWWVGRHGGGRSKFVKAMREWVADEKNEMALAGWHRSFPDKYPQAPTEPPTKEGR